MLRTKQIEFEPHFGELIKLMDVMYKARNEKVSAIRIYQIVYTLCNAKWDNFIDNMRVGFENYFSDLTLAIYERIIQSSDMVKTYSDEFRHYQIVSKNFNNQCSYFNEAISVHNLRLSREVKFNSGTEIAIPKYGPQSVQALTNLLWKVNVVDVLAHKNNLKLMRLVLESIERDRNGSNFDSTSVRIAIQSLIDIKSHSDVPGNEDSLEIYTLQFEKAFLSSTRAYATFEAACLIEKLSIQNYLAFVEKRFKSELHRNEKIVIETTLKKAQEILQEEYLIAYKEKIYDPFITFIENEQIDDCKRMFNLMSKFKGGITPILKSFENLVFLRGSEAVAEFDQLQTKDPRDLVDLLMDTYNRHAKLCYDITNNDAGSVAAFDKGIRRTVNLRREVGGSTAELIAKYTDTILKKPTKANNLGVTPSHSSLLAKFNTHCDRDLESQYNDIILLFKYVDDKDVFQKFYSRFLAKRLIHQNSISHEAEISMIGKLKEACGLEYTSKLNKMISDIAHNTDLNSDFNSYLKNISRKPKFEQHFLTLTAGAWPLNIPNSANLNLPPELEDSLERFSGFYNNKHTGRKLKWLWHLFRGDLKLNFFDRKYEVNGSLLHLTVLLQFNEKDVATFTELVKATNLNESELYSTLKPILDHQILVTDASTSKLNKSNVYHINSTSIVKINHNFSSKRLKIKLQSQLSPEASTEAHLTKKEVDIDRSMFLQSVIVRIMKSRKTLDHTILITEVIQQCSAKFNPSIPTIKKSIDLLLDRGFIERSTIQPQTYVYLA